MCLTDVRPDTFGGAPPDFSWLPDARVGHHTPIFWAASLATPIPPPSPCAEVECLPTLPTTDDIAMASPPQHLPERGPITQPCQHRASAHHPPMFPPKNQARRPPPPDIVDPVPTRSPPMDFFRGRAGMCGFATIELERGPALRGCLLCTSHKGPARCWLAGSGGGAGGIQEA